MWAISAPDWSDFDDCTNIVCGEDGCGGDDDFDDDGDDYFDDAHLDLDHDNVGSILIVSEVVEDHNNADSDNDSDNDDGDVHDDGNDDDKMRDGGGRIIQMIICNNPCSSVPLILVLFANVINVFWRF